MAAEQATSTEISLQDFYRHIQEPGDFVLLDVRNADVFGAWRIESRHTPQTVNVPYFQFVEEDTLEDAVQQVPAGPQVIAVCAHGGASDYVAEILRERGIRAINLAGGMDAWGAFHMFRTIADTGAIASLRSSAWRAAA
jgi:rhodanese-related sulfurtransferase